MRPFRGGSEASEGGEDPGAEQHGGAGEKDQGPGQPNGRVCLRGRAKRRLMISFEIIHFVEMSIYIQIRLGFLVTD